MAGHQSTHRHPWWSHSLTDYLEDAHPAAPMVWAAALTLAALGVVIYLDPELAAQRMVDFVHILIRTM